MILLMRMVLTKKVETSKKTTMAIQGMVLILLMQMPKTVLERTMLILRRLQMEQIHACKCLFGPVHQGRLTY